MPFISDLGIDSDMRVCFTVGLTLTGLAMVTSLIDFYAIRQYILKTSIPRSRFWWINIINLLHLCFGFYVVAGVGALGYFPWDSKLRMHLVVAQAILLGGPIFGIIHVLFATYVRHSLGFGAGWTYTRSLSVPLVLLNIVAVPAMMFYFIRAAANTDFEALLQRAHTDFMRYCSAGDERMEDKWLNTAAVWEWLDVATLLGIVGTGYLDLGIYDVILNKNADIKSYDA